MSGLASRRGFLRGLTTLPLIGGSVALIGVPSAVAAAPLRELLLAYNEWLFMERKILCQEAWPGNWNAWRMVPSGTVAHEFHLPVGIDWRSLTQPSSRAALVLSAVGCDWREGSR